LFSLRAGGKKRRVSCLLCYRGRFPPSFQLMSEATHLMTVLTADRRGIIASITETLATLKIELLELTQTVVSGYFTITLVLAMPPGTDVSTSLVDSIRSHLAEDAAVSLLPFRKKAIRVHKDDHYILTASGAAGTPLVQSLSHAIADSQGNFLELNCQAAGSEMNIMAEIEFGDSVRVEQVQENLQRLAELHRFRIRLQPLALFTATNEIAFRRVGA
jgi:ACT domain-containing protein